MLRILQRQRKWKAFSFRSCLVRRVQVSLLKAQALQTWIFVCYVNLLLEHTLFVSLDMVVAFLPMRLFSSGSKKRVSEMVELSYTMSWTTSSSWSEIVMLVGVSTSRSMISVFFILMVSQKFGRATLKRFMIQLSGW